MTRSKKFRVGITGKIWLAIMLTAVAVIAAIWILQVASMKDYYTRTRRESFSGLLSSIATSVDDKGVVLAQEDLTMLAARSHLCIIIAREDGNALQVAGIPDVFCYVHRDEETKLDYINQAMAQSERFQVAGVSDSDLGSDYFIGTIRSPGGRGGPGYAAVVTQAVDSAKEAISAVQSQMVYISIFLLVIATLSAALVANTVTSPLKKITKAARQIADGGTNVTVDVRSNDEVGDLGESFNYMSREIAKVNTLQRELVANISHDIRTPLTMIKGYAEMIKDITGDDKEMREQQLDIIVDETNRLSTLVSDVMDLSLMQAGQSPLKLGIFNITQKARDILSRFQLLEQTKGFEFHLEADGEHLVNADEVRIEQVLYNLINNAVNHIGEQKRIIVRVREWEGAVRVEVEDTGTGIAQEDLPLIWDRYYKPYKKGEKVAMGTGLGLSIVKAILTNHQSRFGVVSTLGVGSTFWFTLVPAEQGVV